MMNKLMVFAAVVSLAVCAYGIDYSNSELASKLQEVGDELTSIVNGIENNFSAEQALPRLKQLSAQFHVLRTEFANRLEADSMNVVRFDTDVAVTMNKLKKALKEFNANEDISLELREEITKLININLKADYL